MPPTHVHLNGGVNLPDTEAVLRLLGAELGSLVRRYPDGETGDRQQWIFFQLQRFAETPGLTVTWPTEQGGYTNLPQVAVDWDVFTGFGFGALGYAAAYQQSYGTFQQLQAEGVIPADALFQVQYPTPLASLAWVRPEDQERFFAIYESALFADLESLLEDIDSGLAVQWDVAVEFGILAGAFPSAIAGEDPWHVIPDLLARAIDTVPEEVPVGLHLCYGDYEHRHFAVPQSLATQVRVVQDVASLAWRQIDFVSFTVPQDQDDPAYFEPLRGALPEGVVPALSLVAYHPEDQAIGTTARQVEILEDVLPGTDYGVCTECGMARAEREDVPSLIQQHRKICEDAPG
jgi:hypothetical protein